MDWRADDQCAALDAPRLRRDIAAMADLRAQRSADALTLLLRDSLQANIGDLTHASLYSVALTGTKHIVDDYLDAVQTALTWLVETPLVSLQRRRQLIAQADRIHGRPALLLSGGATLGFYHLGVVKALSERALLPEVICGASMGAMIAAGVATRTDEELATLWDDIDQIERFGLQRAGLRQAWSQGALLDPQRMQETIRHNVGRWTFKQAHARTGRVLNISISPTRSGQSPRLLNHLTSPDALICQGALASGAIPGVFPPVTLRALQPDGQEVPYLPKEQWMDGSMHGDLPKMRLARLHNINRFIVSQTNPHVLPFMGLRERSGVLPTTTHVLAQAAWGHSRQMLQVIARVAEPTPLHGWTDLAAHISQQEWRGDINIHPRFQWQLFKRVFSNPTAADVRRFVQEGERATWPRMETIRQHTRLSRMLQTAQQASQTPAAEGSEQRRLRAVGG